jgi:hypothetical protein
MASGTSETQLGTHTLLVDCWLGVYSLLYIGGHLDKQRRSRKQKALQQDMFMHGVYSRQCLLALDCAVSGILWLHTACSKGFQALCLLRQVRQP